MFIHSLQRQPAALFQQATFPWWKKSSCSLKINLFLFMLSAESCFKKSLDVSCCCSMLNCETKETFLKDKHHVTAMPSSECFYLPSELFKYREDGWYQALRHNVNDAKMMLEASSRLVSYRQRKICRKYYNKIRWPYWCWLYQQSLWPGTCLWIHLSCIFNVI